MKGRRFGGSQGLALIGIYWKITKIFDIILLSKKTQAISRDKERNKSYEEVFCCC